MGISPGWGDVYSWDTPDQYIEITGVPDGLYDVVSTANPDGGILEERGLAGGRGDDTARTRICLKGNTVKVMASGAKASIRTSLPGGQRRTWRVGLERIRSASPPEPR